MKLLKCDICGAMIQLKTNMPPTPGIYISGNYGASVSYDVCSGCIEKVLTVIGKPKDMDKLKFSKKS